MIRKYPIEFVVDDSEPADTARFYLAVDGEEAASVVLDVDTEPFNALALLLHHLPR